MIKQIRVLFVAVTFVAAQVVLASIAAGPALAQKGNSSKDTAAGTAKTGTATGKTPDGTKNTGTGAAVSDPNPKKKLEKPDSSATKARETACGNDQNKCYPLYQEMVSPHDARYQARLKAEKAYRDCMVKCVNAPKQRM